MCCPKKSMGRYSDTLCKFLGVTELCIQLHSYFEKYEIENYDCNTYCWQLFRRGSPTGYRPNITVGLKMLHNNLKYQQTFINKFLAIQWSRCGESYEHHKGKKCWGLN